METKIVENLLHITKLKKLDVPLTASAIIEYDKTYYFLTKNFILLFQPYSSIFVKNHSVGFCDSYYLAFQKLYATKFSIKEVLKENGIMSYDYKGQYKKLVIALGLGKILRNTLLWFPNFGTFFAIEVISFTDSYLEESPILFQMDEVCLHCKKCIKACPTGALTESDFVRDNCIRQWQCNFLSPVYNEENKRKLENKILGCNICQRCCPKNINYISSKEVLSKDYQYFFDLDVLAKNCIIKDDERSFYVNYLGGNFMRPLRILSFVLNAMENDSANLYKHYCAIKQYESAAQSSDIKALIKYYVNKWGNTNDFN